MSLTDVAITIEPNVLDAVLRIIGSDCRMSSDEIGAAIAGAFEAYDTARDMDAITRNEGAARDRVGRALGHAEKLLQLLDGSPRESDLTVSGLMPMGEEGASVPLITIGAIRTTEVTVDALRQFIATARAAMTVEIVKPVDDAINVLLREMIPIYERATGLPVKFKTDRITDLQVSHFFEFWQAATAHILAKRPLGACAIRNRWTRLKSHIPQNSNERTRAVPTTRRQPIEHQKGDAHEQDEQEYGRARPGGKAVGTTRSAAKRAAEAGSAD